MIFIKSEFVHIKKDVSHSNLDLKMPDIQSPESVRYFTVLLKIKILHNKDGERVAEKLKK